jgi:enamine deaminase RidA (YjgF/YER057c/UK114 family)
MPAWRESIEIPPVNHGNTPIPMACRIGGYLFTSGIFGRDPVTAEMPESAEQQCANTLRNLANVLKKAGAEPGDVSNVAVYLKDNSTRPLFNAPWLEMFPDQPDRPSRHAHIVPGLAGAVQIQATAVIQSQQKESRAMAAWRTSIDIPPVMHQNPIPMASRIGNMLFSSAISGRDPATGATPATIDEQCANVFKNLANVLAKGGAKPGDVGQMTVFIKDPATRPIFNKYWLEMFPDEHSRPARHTHVGDDGPEVSIEVICVIEG